MKQLIVIFFISIASYLQAQTEPKISEQIRPMSKGSVNAFVMELPGKATSIKSVRNEWLDFVKSYKGKTSYSKKIDEVFADNATIKDMSENTVDISAKVVSKDGETLELIVWYNLGVNYLSSQEYAPGVPVATDMLKEFSKRVSANLLKEQLAGEQKALKEMNSGLKSMQKEASGFDKSIKNYEEDIKEIEVKIAAVKEKEAINVEEQAKQKATIDAQQKKIDNMKVEIENMKSRKRK